MKILVSSGKRVWIVISKNPDATVRADDGYSETIGESYEWVSKLPNGNDISVGDCIVLRDSTHILGFSQIEKISVSNRLRAQNLCPKCGLAQVRMRKTVTPIYMCAGCNSTFDNPSVEMKMLEHKVADYGAGWVSLDKSESTFEGWKQLSQSPKSQHSLQSGDIARFESFASKFSDLETARFATRTKVIQGGHALRTVKTRIGQGAFRQSLLNQFGFNCAITGPNHPAGLEAAHLYSYSKEAAHHSNGGLLLRRDIHTLFDKGLLAIDVASSSIDVHHDLLHLDQYAALQNSKIRLNLSPQLQSWLKIHWDQFRS